MLYMVITRMTDVRFYWILQKYQVVNVVINSKSKYVFFIKKRLYTRLYSILVPYVKVYSLK